MAPKCYECGEDVPQDDFLHVCDEQGATHLVCGDCVRKSSGKMDDKMNDEMR